LVDNRKKDLDMAERDQTYNVNVAVKKARLAERAHISEVVKTHKDKGLKLQTEHTVSIYFQPVSAQQNYCLNVCISYYMLHSLRVIVIEQ